MNHTGLSRLLSYMAENLDSLSVEDLEGYVWLLEELLSEVRRCYELLTPQVSAPSREQLSPGHRQ